MELSSPERPRRSRLIAVAIDLFTRYGVRRTSVDDIAAEAAIAKGSLYLEFRSKDELFRAAAAQVIEDILAAAEAAAAQAGTLEDRLTEILRAKFWRLYDLVHARPHARELIDAKDAVAADVFRAADARFAALVISTLEAAAAQGAWRPRKPYDAAEVGAVLLRAAHGNGYGARRLGDAAYARRLRTAVALIVAGASRRTPR